MIVPAWFKQVHIRILKQFSVIFIFLAAAGCTSCATQHRQPIVFLGDSFAALNDWNIMFNRKDIHNSGIIGNTTEDVYNRLEEIVAFNPSRIFLIVGVNDLGSNSDMKEIEGHYDQILGKLDNTLPHTVIYVHSVFPLYQSKFRQHYNLNISNMSIRALNENLKKQSKEHGAHYIDMYNHFTLAGELDPDLTTDGMHLNRKGYLLWKKHIQKYIDACGH